MACGYFVTTLLQQAGLDLDRVALAECASETMIKSLVQEKYVHRYRRLNYDRFLQAIKQLGEGVYIVGLDYHTGFIICRAGRVFFLHSAPPGVQLQNAEDASFLAFSTYRVVARLRDDTKLLEHWLGI